MSNVTKLFPDNGPITNASMAHRFRNMADKVEAGEHGDVTEVITVIESKGGNLEIYAFGNGDYARVVGLLAYASATLTG